VAGPTITEVTSTAALSATRRTSGVAIGLLALVVLLVGGSLVGGSLVGGTATGAWAVSVRPPTTTEATGVVPAKGLPEPTVLRVRVRRISPAVPGPGSVVTVTGFVDNSSGSVVTTPKIALRTSPQALTSRGDLENFQVGAVSRLGSAPDLVADSLGDAIPAGASVPFQLSAPLDTIQYPGFGVYPLAVVATGEVADAGIAQLGAVRTFLPWRPPSSKIRPSRLSLLWPLIDSPRRDAAGRFIDDSLAASMSPGGRLDTLVDAAANTTVTWVIDPDLIETAQDMTDGYVVASASGRTTPGTGQRTATRWLAKLRAATEGDGQILTVPYADPDLTGLAQAGHGGQITAASRRGESIVERALGRPVISDVAWPADANPDRRTLDAARSAGASAVIVAASSRPPAGLPPSYTPTSRTQLGSGAFPLTGLLSDDTLDDALGIRWAEPDSRAVALQRFRAETAMITAEAPNISRTVLASPDRRWSPDRESSRAIIEAASHSGWITPVTLDALRRTTTTDVDRAVAVEPKVAIAPLEDGPLSMSYLAGLAGVQQQVDAFSQVLPDVVPTAVPTPSVAVTVREQAVASSARSRFKEPFDAALLRAHSTAWRGAVINGQRWVDRLRRELDVERRRIRVVSGTVVLGSSSGTFPVTVVNDRDSEISVQLRLTPRNPRLGVQGGPYRITVGPRQKGLVEVPATAIASGTVVVDARVESRQGLPIGPETQLSVNATKIGTVALFVTYGALIVLFGTAGLRVVRTLWSAARRSGKGL
jgi:hypothetical protein